MKIVLKFGGTSLATPKNIRAVADYIAAQSKGNQLIAVCSALDKTTDSLIAVSEMIKKGQKTQARNLVSKLIKHHRTVARATVTRADSKKKIIAALDNDFVELGNLVDGMALLGEVTPRSMDYLISFGERMSSKILSFAIKDLGIKSAALTGGDAGIITDSNFGDSRPLMDTTRLRVSKILQPLLAKKILPVIGGFTAADQHGRITTFGRGGSDYTATIIASCVRAGEIWLMSDVDGLMTADPKIVPDAKILQEVSYVEAIEMALFGAKQIHPRTFEPILQKKIPMRIRNTFDTGNRGTLITASPSEKTKKTVKCVSVIRHNALIDVRGGSMVGAPGTAAKIFATLASAGVNVMMISQNPSESSITIVVKNADLDRAVSALEMDLLGRIIKKLEVTTDVAIVALIGSGMRGTVGVASRVFTAAAGADVNVVMITQGASELNLAFVVRDSDSKSIVRSLHDEFELAEIN